MKLGKFLLIMIFFISCECKNIHIIERKIIEKREHLETVDGTTFHGNGDFYYVYYFEFTDKCWSGYVTKEEFENTKK